MNSRHLMISCVIGAAFLSGDAVAKTINVITDDAGKREVAERPHIPNAKQDVIVPYVCAKPGSHDMKGNVTITVANDLHLVTGDNAGPFRALAAEKRGIGFVIFGKTDTGWACAVPI
jgi:hypothetical protein